MVKIYAIECTENGYVYIGCTKGKTAKRMREHRCLLKAGKHKSTKLQYDWNVLGEKAFRMVVLDHLSPGCSLEEKRIAELGWMKIYEDRCKLYNLYLVSFRPTEEARQKGVQNAHKEPGNRWTPEANEKRRLAQLGKPKGHGAKISATKRAKKGL